LTSIDLVPPIYILNGEQVVNIGSEEDKMGPSELLAALAFHLYEWGEAGQIEEVWLKTAEAEAREEANLSSDRESMVLAEMITEGRRTLDSADGAGEITYPLFREVLAALQKLDAWHAPLRLASRYGAELDDALSDALWRLQVEGGAYNPPGIWGSIIPPAPSHTWEPDPDKTSVITRVLHETAYLPPGTAAGDPDDSRAFSDRMVSLRYVARAPRMEDGREPIEDCPTIAIAPVLQDVADAELEFRPDPARYGVRIKYDPARLYQIVLEAMRGGSQLLFLPETSVDAGRVPELASAIRRAARDHRKATGDDPELRFVMAGLAHETGGNSIVVLNVEGAPVLEQDKLCRWNLSPEYQEAYQVGAPCKAGGPALREDIPGGKTVYVVDLEHFGRFLTMICADMDYDKPGDWLVRNVAIEWLHAPIMDRSIAWSIGSDGKYRPWIVERAHRATETGVAKVIVTNSLLLTLRSNESFKAPGSKYAPVTECAISFMLDKRDAQLTYRQVSVHLPCATLEVSTFEWRNGFEPFPPPS
jgi:hypothetical protein